MSPDPILAVDESPIFELLSSTSGRSNPRAESRFRFAHHVESALLALAAELDIYLDEPTSTPVKNGLICYPATRPAAGQKR